MFQPYLSSNTTTNEISRTFLVLLLAFCVCCVDGLSECHYSAQSSSLIRDKNHSFGFANFIKHANRSLNATVALNGFVRRPGECAFICANSSVGFSFNFAVESDVHGRHVCEILATDKYKNYTKFISKAGYDHYSIKSLCASFPCRNGATCDSTYEQDTYKCLCKAGFDGNLCENEINECASNPCMNMGVCTDLFAAYKCSCLPGFSGLQCQIIAPGTLLPGGSYVCTSIDSYTFAYLTSYHVTYKQYYTHGCGLWGWWRCSAWRQIYGKAYRTAYRVNYMIGHHCCPGWRNPKGSAECTTNIDECASSPCLNSATCVDLINGYLCNCTAGFIGKHCETNVNECASNPCSNGGMCTDRVNGYSCACVAGYSGTSCDTDVDECASNPCSNGGTCTDQVNSYSCACAVGYSGASCETDVSADPCASNPCKESEVCKRDILNGYDCRNA